MKERRKYPRAEIDVLVNYDINAKAKSKDISEGGICLITDTPLKVESLIKLVFSLGEDIKINAIGKVKWSRNKGTSRYENGLEFWHIEKRDKKRIREYIEK